jgi:hypothetical protein
METQEPIRNNTENLPGFFALLKESFEVIKERFWVYLGITAISIVGYIAFNFLVAISAVLGLSLYFSYDFLFFLGVFMVAILLFVLSGAVLQLWPNLAIFYVVKERSRKVSVLEAMKRSFSKILAGLLISVLFGIVLSRFSLFYNPGIYFS